MTPYFREQMGLEQGERQVFEAWALSRGMCIVQGGVFEGGYLYPSTGLAWRVWQARAAQGGQAAPTSPPGAC